MNKTCTKCYLEKPLEDFNKAKGRRDGYREVCKLCRNIVARSKSYKPSNIKEKQCRECSIIKLILNFHFNKRNLDGYDKDCKDCRKIKSKNQYIKNGEKIRAKRTEYYNKNKIEIWEKKKVYETNKRKNDPFFKLKRNLRNRLWYALKNTSWKKNTHFTNYIGCGRDQLISHLELQFQPGMTWENYGLWEVDHIKPLANAITEQELYNLCHYTNIQPLWELDNQKKSNKS
jgi:hypothetical protein